MRGSKGKGPGEGRPYWPEPTEEEEGKGGGGGQSRPDPTMSSERAGVSGHIHVLSFRLFLSFFKARDYVLIT
jgi:hypothetical protein